VQAHAGHSFHFWRDARSEGSLREPARAALARVGLAERADVTAANLSHGEHRLLEFAMALAASPRMLQLDEPMAGLGPHLVLGTPITPPFPDGTERAVFGMGCFWGAERMFWQAQGVYTTAAGYAGGVTPNPTYQEVCSGQTGHTEVVLAVFDTERTSYDEMLRIFWEGHDPTQGMRQGNDVGTQYRSAIYWTSEAQRDAALASREMFQARLARAGYGEITTEIAERYCVPASLPWRMPCVGSWPSQNTLRSAS